MTKSHKRGEDKKADQFVATKKEEKQSFKEKIEQSTKSPIKRTIKAAPKKGKISGSSINRAVKAVSSSRKKK